MKNKDKVTQFTENIRLQRKGKYLTIEEVPTSYLMTWSRSAGLTVQEFLSLVKKELGE
ncbi:MAG: hypothetical protein LBB45_09065 [Methanobrevibacter sp.]|jgi:hypothetical protein|nr:hypothetical protein [Candidatus Methanovirga basalitermitum]